MPKVFFNVYLTVLPSYKQLKTMVPSSQFGYGIRKLQMKAGQTIQIETYNWRDRSAMSDYTLTTYAEKAPVAISDS